MRLQMKIQCEGKILRRPTSEIISQFFVTANIKNPIRNENERLLELKATHFYFKNQFPREISIGITTMSFFINKMIYSFDMNMLRFDHQSLIAKKINEKIIKF